MAEHGDIWRSPCGAVAARFWMRVAPDPVRGCWLWQSACHPNGYGAATITFGHGRVTGAHRVAWTIANGPIPDGLSVLHTCDVRQCVNPAHLWAGTTADNLRDMAEKGRSCRGERNAQAKLTQAKAEEIRALTPANEGERRDVAARYGVHPETVRRIVRHEIWRA